MASEITLEDARDHPIPGFVICPSRVARYNKTPEDLTKYNLHPDDLFIAYKLWESGNQELWNLLKRGGLLELYANQTYKKE